jgi:VanZ family protein
MIGLHWLNGQPSTPGYIPSPPFDLLAHFAVYGVLTVLVWLALGGRYPWLVVAIVAVYGGADELRQLGLPNRDGSIADFAADLAAALTMTLSLSVLRARNLLPAWLLSER